MRWTRSRSSSAWCCRGWLGIAALAAMRGTRAARERPGRGRLDRWARAISSARSCSPLWMRALSLAGVRLRRARRSALPLARGRRDRSRSSVAAARRHRARRVPRCARVARADRAARGARRAPCAIAWWLLLAWLVAALRAARARSRSGSRSIRGTRGSSGRPRRACGTSWAISSPFARSAEWFAADGAVYFDAVARISADGAAAAGLDVHRARPLGRRADERAVVANRASRSRSRSTARCARSTSTRWPRSSARSSSPRCRSPTSTSRSPATPTCRWPRTTRRRRSRSCAGRATRAIARRRARRCCLASPARRSRCPGSFWAATLLPGVIVALLPRHGLEAR